MKKGLILFTALFLISGFSAFGAVKAVKEGDVVKVTWTYENPDAASVGLVGDLQGWNLAGALPMTKDASGVWTITLDGTATSEYKYKFNVDGEWTEDPTAPAGVDDGFGGTNGYAIVADLLAAAGSGTPVAAGPKGLVVGLYEAVWGEGKFITQNATDETQKGVAFSGLNLNHKAYLKWDGPLYPGLVTVTGEIKVFDGAVTLYKKNNVNDADQDVTWEEGAKSLALLPWTTFNSFGAKWPDLKGKLRTTLTLADLNTKISHSVGWSKTANQNLGDFFVTVFEEPDSNGGITEIYSDKDFDLGGVKLGYLVNFDAQDSGKLKNLVRANVTAGAITAELFSNILYNTTEVGTLGDALVTRSALGVGYSASGISAKVQGGIVTDAANELTDAYFGALSVGYTAKDMFGASTTFKYAGTDAKTNLMETNREKGFSSFDGLFKNNVKANYYVLPTLNAFVENNFEADYKDFTGQSDALKVGVTFKDGIEVTPEVELNLPIDGADFSVSYASVQVTQGGLIGTLYWIPDATFEVNDIRIKATYDLGSDMALQLGSRVLLDADDVTNPFGLTAGFSMKTPFEAVKSPYFFANANYNLSALEAGDSSSLEPIDDQDFIRTNKDASVNVGLRWNF